MEVKVNPATEGSLSEIHQLTADYIILRLQDAKRTKTPIPPAELSAITKFLKDNGIECTKEDMESTSKELHLLSAPEFEDTEEAYL